MHASIYAVGICVNIESTLVTRLDFLMKLPPAVKKPAAHAPAAPAACAAKPLGKAMRVFRLRGM